MSRTDDDAAARARLEHIAWGAGSTPADAARARIALADLDREARRRPVTTVAPAAGPRRGRRPGEQVVAAAAPGVPSAAPVVPEAAPAPDVATTPDVAPTIRTAGPDVHPTGRTEPGDDTGDAGDAPSSVTDGVERDQPSGVTADGRRGAGLPVGGLAHRAGQVFGRVRRTDRTVLWALGGAAVVIGLVAGTGVGLSIGTRSTAEPATTVTTPAAGTVTLEQMLDLPQTYADQLPGGMDAPVSLHTTRLVFTNRSLAGDDAATPWNVWAGVGRDSSTICLVATADRRQGTSACYPRDDALHGAVSLSDTSSSGTLWLRVVGGAVRGTVTSSPAPLY